jgi:hypothetical protein
MNHGPQGLEVYRNSSEVEERCTRRCNSRHGESAGHPHCPLLIRHDFLDIRA